MYVDEVLVTPQEMRVIEAMKMGFTKLKDIQTESKFNRINTVAILRDLREFGYIRYNEDTNNYYLNKGLSFREMKMRNGYVLEDGKEVEFKREKVRLEPTYPKVERPILEGKTTIRFVSKEEAQEMVREMTKHQKFLEFKKGELTLNENYRHFRGSR